MVDVQIITAQFAVRQKTIHILPTPLFSNIIKIYSLAISIFG